MEEVRLGPEPILCAGKDRAPPAVLAPGVGGCVCVCWALCLVSWCSLSGLARQLQVCRGPGGWPVAPGVDVQFETHTQVCWV